MTNTSRIAAWAAATLAGMGALCLLIARAAPQSPVGPLTMQSATHEARAAHSLQGAPSNADMMSARTETLAGLDSNPNNAVAWMRLAWIEDQLSGGAFPQTAQAAVARSYDVAPYGPQVSAYRLTFILDHWSSTPSALREQARSEIGVMWHNRRATLDRTVSAVRSRPGRLAARVIIARLRQQNVDG